MFTVLLVFQVLIAASLIGLVLVQHGKGADMGAAFGSGASGTVFGARGSGSFLTKVTAVLALLFFINSILLAIPAVTRFGITPSNISESVISVETPAAETLEVVSDLPEVPGEAAEQSETDLPDVPGEEPETETEGPQ